MIIILSELRLNTELENGYIEHMQCYDREEREFNTAMKETEKRSTKIQGIRVDLS